MSATRSHLVPRQIIDALGRPTTVWVAPDRADAVGRPVEGVMARVPAASLPAMLNAAETERRLVEEEGWSADIAQSTVGALFEPDEGAVLTEAQFREALDGWEADGLAAEAKRAASDQRTRDRAEAALADLDLPDPAHLEDAYNAVPRVEQAADAYASDDGDRVASRRRLLAALADEGFVAPESREPALLALAEAARNVALIRDYYHLDLDRLRADGEVRRQAEAWAGAHTAGDPRSFGAVLTASTTWEAYRDALRNAAWVQGVTVDQPNAPALRTLHAAAAELERRAAGLAIDDPALRDRVPQP